jgi:serine/threonine-protein kinase HipA
MKRIIEVAIDGFDGSLGELRYDRQGNRESAAFAYAREWLADALRFAIDPSLPLVSGFQFHGRNRGGSIFHGAIADTEPDGWGRRVIMRDHAKRRAASREEGGTPPSAIGELDFLLAVDDESRVGALRFRDESGRFLGRSEASERRTPPLLELGHLLAASRAVETSTESAEDLEYLRGRGTSLGGLRPKCTLRMPDGGLAIGKLPSVSDERAVTKGEVLALHLAQRAGIRAAQSKLVESDGIAVAVIRRFDRRADGTRVPYVSAATMLGAERDDPEPHAYTDLVDALRSHGSHVQADVEELWRRIAFSICINNVDDHLQNHGFLHVGHDQWRLAPAFDINPFPERARELKTWISHDVGPEASLDHLHSVAPYFLIAESQAKKAIAEVRHAVSNWRKVGADLGMTKLELDQFAEAFDTT